VPLPVQPLLPIGIGKKKYELKLGPAFLLGPAAYFFAANSLQAIILWRKRVNANFLKAVSFL
jgi:hypothetical protein